ncbi:HAMP domain-containing histidine kinase [Cohnella pontilimi]|uniref:histidine kinase n=1 Tax=Cohnella pontilimi TaxID=2564100 RepID=A0A4U0FBU6_9BACL|nr:HAMP domain-containing sensor histidine kinase [Cohnella pontilimi]TJY42316.1 HAMP domain-containing histidine kinase [Cohnella pontilimi]
MTPFSIKIKYSLFLAVLLMLTVLVLSLFVLAGIRNHQRETAEQNLLQLTRSANLGIKQVYYESRTPEPSVFLRRNGRQLAMDLAVNAGLRVVLYGQDKEAVGDSMPLGLLPDSGGIVNIAAQGKIAYRKEGSALLYAAPIQGPGKQMGVILFQYPLAADLQFYGEIRNLFVWSGTVVTAVSFVLGYLFFGRSASSVIRLSRTAERIRSGEYPSAPPLKRSKDELGRLSESIYYMSSAIRANLEAMKAEESKLRQAVDKLQLMERQQKEFIGNISHEFKTPLTSIKAYVELMAMYPDDPALRSDAVGNIGKETARLHDMVEKVLRLSVLEKYDFEYHAEQVDLRGLLEDLAERMKARARRLGLSIRIELSPALVLADRESLTHIFVNLLDNAMKYNVPGGEILITCRERHGQAIVDVSDTGIGILETERERIFEPFQTANKDRSRQTGGAGLGLPLAKRLAEKQGGTLTLLPDDKHTVFRVQLPALPE